MTTSICLPVCRCMIAPPDLTRQTPPSNCNDRVDPRKLRRQQSGQREIAVTAGEELHLQLQLSYLSSRLNSSGACIERGLTPRRTPGLCRAIDTRRELIRAGA